MAATISIALKAIDQYSGVITGLNQGFELVGKAVSAVKWTFDQLYNIVSSVASVVANFAISAVKSLGETGNMFEQLGTRMETIFGGKGEAQKALTWAAEFGARTPLELNQVAEAMIKLKTYGFDPYGPMLQAVGDAAFALGQDFDGIVDILGKMQLTGTITSRELMQLAQRNIPVFEVLRKEFSLSDEQLSKIGEQGLNVDRAINAIVASLGTKFSGAMDRASATAQGAWSTINDVITVFQKKLLDAGPWEAYRSQVVRLRDLLSEYLGGAAGVKIATALGETIAKGMSEAVDAINKVLAGPAGLAARLIDTFDARPIKIFLESLYALGGEIARQSLQTFPALGHAISSVSSAFSDSTANFSDVAAGAVSAFFGMVTGIADGVNSLLGILTDARIFEAVEFFGKTIMAAMEIPARLLEIQRTTQELAMHSNLEAARAVLQRLQNDAAYHRENATRAALDAAQRDVDKYERELAALIKTNNALMDMQRLSDGSYDALGRMRSAVEGSRVDVDKIAEIGKKSILAIRGIAAENAEQIERANRAMTLGAETSLKVFSDIGILAGQLGGINVFEGMLSEEQRAVQTLGTIRDIAKEIETAARAQVIGVEASIDAMIRVASLSAPGMGLDLFGSMFGEQQQPIQQPAQESPLAQVKDYLRSIDWPAQMQPLGEALFGFLLNSAEGEAFPMAVVSGGAR